MLVSLLIDYGMLMYSYGAWFDFNKLIEQREYTLFFGSASLPIRCSHCRYLKVNAIFLKHQNRFHFFNNFFFQKLLETTTSLGVDECKVDYQKL